MLNKNRFIIVLIRKTFEIKYENRKQIIIKKVLFFN